MINGKENCIYACESMKNERIVPITFKVDIGFLTLLGVYAPERGKMMKL